MRALYILWFTLLFSACSHFEAADNSSRHLITPDELADLLQNKKQIRLLEFSSDEAYFKGHILNAVLLKRDDYRDTTNMLGGMMATMSEMEHLLQNLGIEEGDTLVLYGEHSNVDACRFFWILESYGHTNSFILDGGKKAWQELFPLSVDNPQDWAKTNYRFSADSKKANNKATAEDVLAAMNGDVQIVDTRSTEEYLGQPFINKGVLVKWKNGASINGTIPGAKHFHWTRLQHYESPYGFKSKEDIEDELNKAGIDPDGEIILFCQSGARSSHTLFALRHILGNEKVKNFDGSWIEWSSLYANNPDLISQISTEEQNLEIFNKLDKEITKNNG